MPLSLTGRQWMKRGDAGSLSPSSLSENPEALRRIEESSLLDAAAFPDYLKLRSRIERAIDGRETIGIFGDYDCDGITAAALWARFLRRRGIDPVVRLPHRLHDGYGLKPKHIDELHAQGVQLLLVVDTGISAHDAAVLAAEKGIDLCIVDHHHPPPTLPVAHAIIHPAHATVDAAPSAATLSYALIRAMERGAWDGHETDTVLATLGTVADVMPLTGANRALVREGLSCARRLPDGPLRALLFAAGIDGECTARDIAFAIAPRINAAGRMDDPKAALDALLNGGEAITRLTRLNTARQDQVEHLREQQWSELGISETALPKTLPAFLFSLSTNFPPGVIGLLAGKLTERTGRPALVGCIDGDTVTASLRSPRSYDVTAGLTRAQKFLQHFGGHAQAAGCSFALKDAAHLERALLADARACLTASTLVPTLEFDAVLENAHLLTTQAVASLATLEPFGAGNPEPRFVVEHAFLERVRSVGSDGSHLQAALGAVPLIGFRLAHLQDRLSAPVDLLCRLSLNTWNNRTTPQLVVEDIRQTEHS